MVQKGSQRLWQVGNANSTISFAVVNPHKLPLPSFPLADERYTWLSTPWTDYLNTVTALEFKN